MRRCQAITGLGSVKCHDTRRRAVYAWSIYGDSAREILREVYPHLVAKQHEARLAYGYREFSAYEGLKLLHQGLTTTADAPAPPSCFEPGWYLRQCVIWHKPNAMPESVRDRCTTSHSYVFLFSRSPRYFFDADAIAEPAEWAAWGAQTDLKRGQPGSENARGTGMGFDTYGRQRIKEMQNGHGSKNARSVWTIPTQGYPGAHFATWPEKLVERILLAGCPEAVCSACGKARERINVAEHDAVGRTTNGQKPRTAERRGFDVRQVKSTSTVGWSDCGCGAEWTPGVCLDPFAGSGTTLQVARRLGRRSVGVELNADYCRMIGERLQQLSLLA